MVPTDFVFMSTLSMGLPNFLFRAKTIVSDLREHGYTGRHLIFSSAGLSDPEAAAVIASLETNFYKATLIASSDEDILFGPKALIAHAAPYLAEYFIYLPLGAICRSDFLRRSIAMLRRAIMTNGWRAGCFLDAEKTTFIATKDMIREIAFGKSSCLPDGLMVAPEFPLVGVEPSIDDPTEKTLIYLCNGIGNFIQASPIFQACKEMGQEVSVFIPSEYHRGAPISEIAGKHPFVDVALRETPDLASYHHVAVFGMDEKTAASAELEKHYATRVYKAPDWIKTRMHESEYYMQFPRDLGYQGETPMGLCPFDSQFNVEQFGDYCFLAPCKLPGFPWTKTRWPHQKWARLADCIIRYFGVNVVILGGKCDEEEAVSILGAIPSDSRSRVCNLVGRTSILETAAIVKGAKFFCSLDNGISHIAATFDKRGICLYGPTIITKCRQRALPGRISFVESNLSCAPCHGTKLFFSCKDSKCMRGIEVGDVMALLRSGDKEASK